jgi:hypothetical protein
MMLLYVTLAQLKIGASDIQIVIPKRTLNVGLLGGRTQNGEEALFQSMEIGSFNVISAAADIGLNGPLAERLIPVSSPILRQYEVLLNQKSIIKFDPNKI